jgi:NAD(P)-dependent dehydrogenase (short-subunit alcohol dehydrogenase family)
VSVAIVTGGNTGIGRAAALELARRGFDVAITFRDAPEAADSLIREIEQTGRRGVAEFLDLSRAENGPAAVDALADRLGGLDALVNNAGFGITGPVLEVSVEEWRAVLEVNLTGAFLCAQAAARRMVAAGSGGAIVNVTSVHEHIPLRGSTPYVAAKHGLGGVTQTMAMELGAHGVRVNSVAPGQIATRQTGRADGTPREIDIPLGRSGAPQEVGRLIAWLCSEEASYVTGSSYVIDGGLSLLAADAQ